MLQSFLFKAGELGARVKYQFRGSRQDKENARISTNSVISETQGAIAEALKEEHPERTNPLFRNKRILNALRNFSEDKVTVFADRKYLFGDKYFREVEAILPDGMAVVMYISPDEDLCMSMSIYSLAEQDDFDEGIQFFLMNKDIGYTNREEMEGIIMSSAQVANWQMDGKSFKLEVDNFGVPRQLNYSLIVESSDKNLFSAYVGPETVMVAREYTKVL